MAKSPSPLRLWSTAAEPCSLKSIRSMLQAAVGRWEFSATANQNRNAERATRHRTRRTRIPRRMDGWPTFPSFNAVHRSRLQRRCRCGIATGHREICSRSRTSAAAMPKKLQYRIDNRRRRGEENAVGTVLLTYQCSGHCD